MPHYVSRASWGAAPPRGYTPVRRTERDAFVVHYSTGEELGREDCAAWVRNIQEYHQDTKRWDDVGYNFLVCKHGDVFVGRGWDGHGAHAPGWNRRGLGVCFLGDDDPGQDVPPAARRALHEVALDADRLYGRRLRRLGHRETQRAGYTKCPGDELHEWVHAGMPLDQSTAEQESDVTVNVPVIALDPATRRQYLTNGLVKHYMTPASRRFWIDQGVEYVGDRLPADELARIPDAGGN